MLAKMLANWKTTLGGVLLIAIGGIEAIGVVIPGVTVNLGAALTMGIPLILASDA